MEENTAQTVASACTAISAMVNGPHGTAVVIGGVIIFCAGMGTFATLALTGHFPKLMINNISVQIPDTGTHYNPAV